MGEMVDIANYSENKRCLCNMVPASTSKQETSGSQGKGQDHQVVKVDVI